MVAILLHNNFRSILTVTGAGMTIGLVVFMVFFAKSAQFKQLGRLSIGPAVFNINEPIVFATPIVMNPIMAVPFIITPIVSSVVTYFALYTGLVPLYCGTSSLDYSSNHFWTFSWWLASRVASSSSTDDEFLYLFTVC